MMRDSRQQQRRLRAYIGAVAIAAIASFATLARLDSGGGYGDVHWTAFGLFAVLLFVSESKPSLWMRTGEGREVTPGWSFAYALVLLGAPTAAVIVMVVTNLYVDVRHHKGTLKIVFNCAQVATALSTGGIILHGFGVHGGIADGGSIPTTAAIGIVVGGVAIFTISGMLTAIVIGIHQNVAIGPVLRSGFGLSMTADGALLALAPVFVISFEYSIIMLPLLGVTSYLVYYATRNALRQQHEATHDPLTMLLNRRAFDERVENAIDSAPTGSIAVMVMDLDRFKDINDRLGHQVGDRLLVSFAQRLERVLPPGGIASRLGGDEFGVLVVGIPSQPRLEAQTEQLQTALTAPHDIDGFPLTVAVSIGVATNTDAEATAEALTAAADIAMYRAKRRESNVEFRGPEHETDDYGRIGLLQDLSAAIEHQQIRAHYQPQINLSDGSVAGVEALMRWNHPTHGPIAPGEFIGLAEQTDLIGPMTELMFKIVMRDCRRIAPDVPRIGINVAPRSLLDRQFATRILGIVHDVGFPADRLEIEITERAIVSGSERTTNALDQFRDAGVTVSIDDFGTGYSSFQVLRNIQANRLKIDRQFSSWLDRGGADEMIVTKIIELAHGLGLEVVAEGVESRAVRDRLAELGCDIAQGYALARPMPIDALNSWLEAHRVVTDAPRHLPTPRLRIATP